MAVLSLQEAWLCCLRLPLFFFPSYVSSAELSALQQALPADQLAPILFNLEEVRISIFTSDAWRSFIIVVIGVALVWMYGAGKMKASCLVGLLAVLCSADVECE